ncbi:bifunctional DNA primase/polymerase [Candidatus Nitrosocosmicus sp. T]
MSTSPDPDKPFDFWCKYIGVNCIPFDSKNKVTHEPWSKWQDQPIPIEVYEAWKTNGFFEKGMAVICGKIWRGENKGKYLACIDIDNKKGVEEFLSHIRKYDTLEKLAQYTLVEQHKDDPYRAHIYFIVEKPLSKKSGIGGIKQEGEIDITEIPAIEVKSEGHHGIMIVSPSIHKDGYPYEIIGTREPAVLNDDQSGELENAINSIYTKYFKEAKDKEQIPISELFTNEFEVYQGNNRHLFLLRTMESLIKRNHEILEENIIKKLAYYWNQKHCIPPLDEDDFEKQWKCAKKYIVRSDNNKDKPRKNDYKIKQTQADSINETMESNDDENESSDKQLVTLVEQRCMLFFIDQFNDIFVSVEINDHTETLPIDSSRFQSLILKECFENDIKKINKDKIKYIVEIIKSRKEFNTNIAKNTLNLRVARGGDTNFYYYYDLTNAKWEVIKISSEGWDVVSDNKPIFRRYKNSSEQVYPKRQYSDDCIERFLKLINLHSHKDKLLVLVYILSLFIPDISKPILLIHGSKGASKTTTFELIKNIVDPTIVDTSSFPKEVNDLIQMLSHNYLAYFDNISKIPDTLSDLLCRAVTGTGFSKRKLYTDDEDISYNYKRCIGINGINIASARPDFLDRSLIIKVDTIPKNKRRKEQDIKNEFRRLLPDILGWIFDILVKALRYKEKSPEKIKLPEYPRLADFAENGEIISRCMGYKENEFINAYFENIQIQNDEVVESSLLAKVVLEFMESQEKWEGSASELQATLTSFLETKDQRLARSRTWPNAANSLSRKLNELASTLKEKGIDISHKYDNYKKGRTIVVRNIEKIPSLSSYRSSNVKEDGKTSVDIHVIENMETIDIDDKSLIKDIVNEKNGDNRVDMFNNNVDTLLRTEHRIGYHYPFYYCKQHPKVQNIHFEEIKRHLELSRDHSQGQENQI